MSESAGFAALEDAVRDACGREAEWAAGVVAGIYTGVDFAIARPEIAEPDAMRLESADEFIQRQESLICRLAALLTTNSPPSRRRADSADEALVAGLVGIAVDHLRRRRLDQLAALRPELVLMALLPYLGFEGAQRWAAGAESGN